MISFLKYFIISSFIFLLILLWANSASGGGDILFWMMFFLMSLIIFLIAIFSNLKQQKRIIFNLIGLFLSMIIFWTIFTVIYNNETKEKGLHYSIGN